jgi:hypothetical protein
MCQSQNLLKNCFKIEANAKKTRRTALFVIPADYACVFVEYQWLLLPLPAPAAEQ